MKETMRRLWRDESGLTVLEYGLAAAAIAVIIGVAYKFLGKRIVKLFKGTGTDGAINTSDIQN